MKEPNESITTQSETQPPNQSLTKKRSLILKSHQPNLSIYPICLSSNVLKGFGRGSKELNCPTANLNPKVLEDQSKEYLRNQNVFEMVMSIGFNPVYGNEFKTIEVHVLFEFDQDFYGVEMKVMVLGYIRPEYNYTTKDELITDIEIDKQVAKNTLKQEGYFKFVNDKFFE
ncbi:uncharacterized protein MELLADRAFT_102002 [Melampsora larici-populina 98AG31]|uniref:Riboflavin kinase n=1 Tax=Melampsora larici-populina (strain 98AG31 / pathotype 3-4-7) TaxID=747676 RepID=F4R5N1_MELLP|nr:uncharacterized protein MELLADRAFT_102002 [Melampsora larici-populina 98AG31]EGG12078.1 hypothetical protein MELLADRAFT_102002 [Melampsora larici-populina 98AG31]